MAPCAGSVSKKTAQISVMAKRSQCVGMKSIFNGAEETLMNRHNGLKSKQNYFQFNSEA